MFFFFFQAEDGIRDTSVTGVQTCALPISSGPLNAALAAKSLESQVNAERAAFAEGADLLIVAPPGDADLQAIVFIFDAEPVSHRLETVGERKRVFLLVRQRSEEHTSELQS